MLSLGRDHIMDIQEMNHKLYLIYRNSSHFGSLFQGGAQRNKETIGLPIDLIDDYNQVLQRELVQSNEGACTQKQEDRCIYRRIPFDSKQFSLFFT